MTSLERAIAELQAGHPREAEAIVAADVERAATQHGPASPEWAAAQFDLGQILLGIGDLPRSAEALRRAADVPAPGPARRQQLTYLMNLGDVLHRMGRLTEARLVHEEGLRGREAFYGPGSEGHAFGQEPLAEVLLAQGELEAAEGLADRALQTLCAKGNRRAVPVAALRAGVRAARYGGERPLLEVFDSFPAELRAELVQACLERAQADPPAASLEVISELRERFEELGDEAGEHLLTLVAALSNLARQAQAHAPRVEALEWLRDHFRRLGDTARVADAWQALALAWDDAGDAARAEDAYRQALEACAAQPALRARVLRNRGLFLADRKRPEEAEQALREAVAAAESSGEQALVGATLVAHGIFVQHAGRLPEAQPLLERGLSLLPAASPDAVFARTHLEALAAGRACGCGELRGALSKTLEGLVRAQLPEDLLEGIEIESLEKLTLKVALRRPPTEPERELLDRAIREGVGQLRTAIESRGPVAG